MSVNYDQVELIQAKCRDRLCVADYEFITEVLGHQTDAMSVVELLRDPDARDIMLDEPILLDVMMNFSQDLKVSSRLYLYVVMRKVLVDYGIDDRAMTDYIAEMLATYLHSSKLQRPAVKLHPMGYMFNLTKRLKAAEPDGKFPIRVHIGNFALFLLGVYPERLRSRSKATATPKISFVETLGSNNLMEAARTEQAINMGLSPVLRRVARNFRRIRLALNLMGEHQIFAREEEASQREWLLT